MKAVNTVLILALCMIAAASAAPNLDLTEDECRLCHGDDDIEMNEVSKHARD